MTTGVILLAGGIGSRMKAPIPKQFLTINQKPIIHYCYELFLAASGIAEISVVCPPEYQHFFTAHGQSPRLSFALPGLRRQDSVYNGLQAMKSKHSVICVHDGVRPFISQAIIQNVIDAAKLIGAATVGVPVKSTIKECDKTQMVLRTPDRSILWEIQTPQAIQRNLLEQGFEFAIHRNITVTDDVSLVELLGKPVKIVEGSYSNIKITTPDDLVFAEQVLKNVQL